MIEVAGLERAAFRRRDRRLRVLAVQALADGPPVGEGDRGIGRGHGADLGVERRDASAPVGEAQAVRE